MAAAWLTWFLVVLWVLSTHDAPDQTLKSNAEFQALFNPRGIALIGASTDPARLGYGMARNLLHSGYHGTVYLVNLHGGSSVWSANLPIHSAGA